MLYPKYSRALLATLFVLGSAVSPVRAGDGLGAPRALPPPPSADVTVLDGGFFGSTGIFVPGSLLRFDGDGGAMRSGISLGLRIPLDTAVAADGSIVSADSFLGNLSTPGLLHTVPGVGTRVIPIAAELAPVGVAFDSTGRLLVTSFGDAGPSGADGGQLLVVDPATGQATDLLPGFDFGGATPFGVAVSAADEIYISTLGSSVSILRVDTANLTADPVAEGLRPAGLPYLAVDPNGWLVMGVEIAAVPTLIRIDPSGVAADETILSGAPFSNSAGIAVDAAGTIFVVNSSFDFSMPGPLELIEIDQANVRILPTFLETNGASGVSLTADGDPVLARLPPGQDSFVLASQLWRFDRIDQSFETVMASSAPAGSVASSLAVASSREAYAIALSIFDDGTGAIASSVGIIQLDPATGSVDLFYESLGFISSIFQPELVGDLAIDTTGRLVAVNPVSGLLYVDRTTGDASEIATDRPLSPEGIVVEPGGSYLVVAPGPNDGGTLERVDPETGSVTRVLSPIVQPPLSIANLAGLALDSFGHLLVPVLDDSISGDDKGRVVRVLLPNSVAVQAQTAAVVPHVVFPPNVTEYPLANPAAVAVNASGKIFIADRGFPLFSSNSVPGQIVRVDLLGNGSEFGPELVAPADMALVPEPGLSALRAVALLALAIFARSRVRGTTPARSEC